MGGQDHAPGAFLEITYFQRLIHIKEKTAFLAKLKDG
ncbi:hypothetical protein MNBD_GAMMA19-1980 [hydrothermal vent metagenome]|uniref:Uncharacterized protein n=1 Tax=hydrothermal vent metagenome TaxID=652676 RepID=A0A3B1AX03_9ZZZZ